VRLVENKKRKGTTVDDGEDAEGRRQKNPEEPGTLPHGPRLRPALPPDLVPRFRQDALNIAVGVPHGLLRAFWPVMTSVTPMVTDPRWAGTRHGPVAM